MSQQSGYSKKLPFAHDAQIGMVGDEINERIRQRTEILRNHMISSSNVHRLKHGRQWQTIHADDPNSLSETQLHSTEYEINRQRIIDHDVGQLTELLSDLPEKMHKIFLRTMYETVHDASQRTGNIVSGKNFKASFIEGISQVKFGVDHYGVPTPPQLHIHPEVWKKYEKETQHSDPDYDETIRRITEAKKIEALGDEARRITRYKIRKG